MTVLEKLAEFRKVMKNKGIDYYLVPTCDYHMSEYICPHFEGRMFLSGFSGDAGTLLIGRKDAYLWTDGRFFTQAEEQLDGSGITLCKIGEENTPKISEFLESNLKKGDCFSAFGKTLSTSLGAKFKKICKKNKASFMTDTDLLDEVWIDRPLITYNPIVVMGNEIYGRSVAEKIEHIRTDLKENSIDGYVFSKLDEVMYIFNIRGSDIAYNPVAFSYAYVDKKRAILFVDKSRMDDDLVNYAKDNGFLLYPYDGISKFIKNEIKACSVVGADYDYINYAIFNAFKKVCKLKQTPSCIETLKAVKTDKEIENIKEYFIKDSAAATMALKSIDDRLNCGEILTEADVSDIFYEFRKKIDGFLEESFPTIAAYGSNGAIIHYVPSGRGCVIENNGLMAIDSGGQYKSATTDLTRTIAVGQLTDEEKTAYTYVSLGMLELMNTTFAKGCNGRNLDILARHRLWKNGKNFNHGTGHGVGCGLNVHEGPCAIRYKYSESDKYTELKPGMLITDEPGYYEPGKFGVRTENTLLVVLDKTTEYGEFYKFESLTWVLLDVRCFDKNLMSLDEIKMVNDYQNQVYSKISPYIDTQTREWLNNRLYL